MENVRLLIVEDDEDDFVLTKDLLDEFMEDSYQLDWVKNVKDARCTLKKDAHDLCLMDYQLGSEDGIQLLKEASNSMFSGPIIMLTGLIDKELDAMALKAGAVDYLVKANLTRDHLERAIRYALARKETERERVERLRAESASRAKSEFLAHLSHELRTPLTAILGYSDMLYGKVSNLEDKSYLQIIHQNGKHLLGLLNDVLDLSKIEAGKFDIEKSHVDLQSFFTDIYFLMNVKAEDKDLEFIVEFQGEHYPTIYTDPIRYRQIVINLISNAIKFTQQGSVTVEVYVEQHSVVPGEPPQTCLTVCVSDTGIGIDPKKVENIFQPFTQVASIEETTEQGTGLGLTISRELAQRMGGELSVESTVGQGSHFYCRLGMENIVDEATRHLYIRPSNDNTIPVFNNAYKGTVLVVDDLIDIRRLIGHFIEKTGVEVIYAENGLDACDIIEISSEKDKNIDLIFMDIQMPKLDGKSAVKRIRSMGYAKPVIALTASSMKGDREKCLQAGFTEFLGKPVESQQLHSILDRYLIRNMKIENDTTEVEIVGSLHSEPKNDTETGPKRCVLVIEDNVDACTITALLIEQLNWKVLKAFTAKEARELVKENKLEAIIFDVNLPDANGYDLVEEMRLDQISNFQSSPEFVALTGQEANEEKAIALGIKHHLMKPVNAVMLESVLQK